jgi:hypothetical protein
MSTSAKINFASITNRFAHLNKAVKCNLSDDVYKFIRPTIQYVFELPDTNEILNVVCKFKGINTAEMEIQSHIIDGTPNEDDEKYCFSYNYDSYDSIHFDSFQYKQKCNVYMSIDDLFA